MKSKTILVTGGAGYIGSHAARALAARGYIPVTYDSLVYGHRWAVQWGPFVQGDIGDRALLVKVMREHRVSAVLHFAAFAYVGESMIHPEKYFENNVTKSLALLDASLEVGVPHVVFSSSCATYGMPDRMPITEDTPQLPVNPYGETKLIVERALRWYGTAHPLSWIALRYFNAAGAEPENGLGEVHDPETHLIPLVLDAAMGRRTVEVYGNDYPTNDGTCVRDYIHVSDLAEAHVLALEYLMAGGPSMALNLGTGEGHSVNEVIGMVQRVTDRTVPHRVAPRRAGDPAVLVADPSLAGKILGWRPQRSSLESIVSSAWKWHAQPDRDKFQRSAVQAG
ncbi:MAG: UDP-glucose 4-epimerase GalE [Acidobacteriaceae bacterium]